MYILIKYIKNLACKIINRCQKEEKKGALLNFNAMFCVPFSFKS